MIKLTAILMLLGCLQLSARSYGQISISKKNASLQELFLDIYKQSGYYFYCNDNLLSHAKKVDIDVKNASLPEVLEICFRNQPLTFTITDRVIVVKAKVENPAPKPEAGIDVHGRVMDENGDPVPGVTVSVKGTKAGVSTDANGEFNLETPDKNAVLIFTSANMETVEVPLNERNNFSVTLKTKIAGLQDVIVNKGYYETSQRLNTGSVSIVKASEIEKQPVSNPLEAIEGRMAGVYVQQTSGVSGSGFNIEIRGRNSLRNNPTNNGNLPFYIVDGVPISSTSLDQNTNIAGQITPQSSPLNTINPSDIESIEVLKDADATAIYGSRGASGVVLITTKKGRPGKTKVSINAYKGAGKVTRMMNLLNTKDYLQMRHEAFNNDGVTPQYYDYDLNGTWDTARYTDWQKTLIGGTAHLTSMQASLSGGNQNTQFLLGGGFYRQGTVFPGNFADQKGSAHFSLHHRSENKRLTTSISASYTAEYNNLPNFDPTNSALNLAPVAPPIYNDDRTLNWANGSWQNFTNPLALFLQPYKGITNNLLANAIVGYQLFNDLEIKTSFGFNNSQIQQTALVPISSQDPSYAPMGYGNYSTNGYNGWIVEPQVEYQRKLPQGMFSVLFGSTFQQNISQAQSFFAENFTSDALLENLLAAPTIHASVFNYAKYKYNALFGRINYNLKDRYMINLTGRRDGSSRFGPGKQFADFGAIGIGWIYSNEPFMKPFPFISYGKIKGSYGTTGSDQIGDYGYLDTYTPTSYAYNGTGGLLINRLFNPNYAWETNRKIAGTIESGFLKNRILLTISYYRNQSSNQLIGYPLPTITGQPSLPFYNLPATVRNTGWEFELTTTNLHNQQIKWTTSINLSIPRNKLVSYPGIEKSSYANIYTVGHSLYVRKTYHYTGIDPQSGIYQFNDVDKDGNISYPNDLENLKEISKEFYGGILNSVGIKHFQLDIFFQYVKQTGLNYLNYFQSPGTLSNQPYIVTNRWQKQGDIKEIQQFSQDFGSMASSAYSNLQSSDKLISDASFIRLKNISISYQFPTHILSKLKIDLFKVFLQGQNLITFTHYLGLDPETQSLQSIPPLKMLTGGFQIIL